MLRTTFASSRALRVGVLGLVTVTTAILITSDNAEARRHRRHAARHHHSEAARESYSPQFASIVVDGNTGSVLTANSPDGLRHPASLTKIMTLYLLFERLDSGKMKLDTEMPVSEHASEQDPTKLGLRPGQTIRVEDAIKGLVTRSANDAAVVIAEAIGGSEDDFARMMTRKARALGMSRTTYRNASGLPNDEQITTARDQSTLGRAIQDRFPRYYRYFSTTAFNFRGHTITGHNRLLGSVEGVDGIKTGYTRASGFNLVTSIHRGNRFLVGVVLGGRSGGSRDAIMRNLLAENIGKGSTTRTAAAISERNPADANVEVADADDARSADTAPVAASEPAAAAAAVQPPRPASKPSLMAAVAAALPPPPAKPEPQAKPEPAPLTSGVIQTQPIAAIPGSAEPMKPVKVKTVQVKAGQIKLAAAGPAQSAPPITSTIPSRGEVPETSNAMMARAAETSRPDMPPQPAHFGTGNGILGVLPASAVQAPAPAPQAVASNEPTRSLQAAPQTSAVKPGAAHSGWIIQVGALESEGEANKRIDLARSSARGLLSKADPFTEVVAKDNRKLYRARFAGLERDQAEAACKTLKRAEISCITVRN
ncbi:D-alanyl-D-alanine carboxypeptidase [Bradyrhizobium sp. CCBAU 53421]|uniref:D-alanyl-D-alanine carboxypeptidase n=1 Tax=Bradyrhizobium sp. CCBAU 53421 TaxID=1325120 RepID=UPI00188A5D2F|nr:D-alanyl-D-alanine carboxypeptidase [Bradyrhizobium sp. CCBAU 53421]QOZ33955.1 peptidase M15 [Bradyrhizobium sp. CCBAU 53421]